MGLDGVAKDILKRKDFTVLDNKDASGGTALHAAAKNGLVDLMAAILRRTDFSEADASDSGGRTALHWATVRGGVRPTEGLKMVQVLPDSSSFTALGKQDSEGCTALHLAA